MIQPDPLPGQDSGPPVTLYQYDAAGDLTGETLPDGSQLTGTIRPSPPPLGVSTKR